MRKSKERKIIRILERLNSWSESREFEYREYVDEENVKRHEFSNGHCSFSIYKTDNLNGCGFWYGARHHMPIKLVKDIVNFLYKYGN